MIEKREPLFVRYANRHIDTSGVVQTFIAQTDDPVSKQIAEDTLNNLPDLSVFKKDFRAALEDIIENGINRQFINYVDSYMKPSLLEQVSEGGVSRVNERRMVIIKEKGTPWIEAVLCYGVLLYLKAYGIKELKRCPVCTKIFTTKGKYAKYCSDDCKSKGST
jgi:hypothetical protein